MKWTLTFLASISALWGCSSVPRSSDTEHTPALDRGAWAVETMQGFGYQASQYQAGQGMATIDDFSAPRAMGGAIGLFIDLGG
jgi:hypothetical protein